MSLVHVNKRCVLTIVIGVIAAIVVVGSVVLVVLCFHFTNKNANSVVVFRWGANKNKMVEGRNAVNGTVFLPLQYTVAEDSFPSERAPLMVSFLYNIQYYNTQGYTTEEFTTPMLIVAYVYFDYDQVLPFWKTYGNFSQTVRENYLKSVFKNMTDLKFDSEELNFDAHRRGSTIVLNKVNTILQEYIVENGFPFNFKNNTVTYVRPFKTD